MSKYGIFKANIFVKRPPLKMLDIIESDNYIGKPLEVFDTAEQAVSKMNEEYFSSIKKVHQYPRGHFYDCTTYFVSECVSIYGDDDVSDVFDIDELESTGNSRFFKGVSQLKRELKIEPKRFCIKEKNIDGSKVTACGEVLYFKCDVKRLKWYVQECISDREVFEDMQCEEHYTSDEVKECDTYIHVVS